MPICAAFAPQGRDLMVCKAEKYLSSALHRKSLLIPALYYEQKKVLVTETSDAQKIARICKRDTYEKTGNEICVLDDMRFVCLPLTEKQS